MLPYIGIYGTINLRIVFQMYHLLAEAAHLLADTNGKVDSY